MKLRDIWDAAKGIIFGERKRPEPNLFTIRYNAMNLERQKLSAFEQDRMMLFTAVAQMNGKVKNYADYIVQMAAFCDECIRYPDSPWAFGIEQERIARLKTHLDLVVESYSASGKLYMDRVRSDMIVPIDRKMLERAREYYYEEEKITLLREISALQAGKRSP